MSRLSRHTRPRGRHYGGRSVRDQLHQDDTAGFEQPEGAEAGFAEPRGRQLAEPEGGEPGGNESEFGEAEFGEAEFGEAGFGDAAFGEPEFDEPEFDQGGFSEPAFGEPGFGEPEFDEPEFDQGGFSEPGFGEAEFDEPEFDEPEGGEGDFGESGAELQGFADELDMDLQRFTGDPDLDPDQEFGEDDGEPGTVAPLAGGVGPGSGHNRSRTTRRRRHRRIMTALGIVVALIVAVGVGGVVWAHGVLQPGGQTGPRVTVSIPRHSSLRQIGDRLARAGVIRSALLFPYFAKLEERSPLLPGTYHLAKGSSYNHVLLALETGPPIIQEKLVIPEGFTLDQIAQRIAALPKFHLSAAKVLADSSSGKVRSPYEPAGTNNLEGLVFPATYEVTQGESEAAILRQMVEAFDIRADEIGLTAGARAMHRTPYQVVTVASMVEREANMEVDRGPIASVIYNRLKINMKLQIDSTLMYGLKITNPNKMNLNSTNPYNTYRYTGLPPTPIASPGLPSLEAALHPPKTTYLYYAVVDPDGQSAFASTYTQFQKIQATCRARHLC